MPRSPFIFQHLKHCFCGCCSVAKSCLTLCDPTDGSMPGSPVLHTISQSLLKFKSIESVMLCIRLILFHPLLLSPPIFPSIRVFSDESALCIRWPKYWSFNFSISPSNEYSGLISFRIDRFDLLAVQGISRVFSSITIQSINSLALSLPYGPTLTSIHDY